MEEQSLPNDDLLKPPQPLNPLPLEKPQKTRLLFKITLVVLIALFFGSIAGLFLSKQFLSVNPSPTPIASPPITELVPTKEATISGVITNAHNDFGFNIFQQLLNEDKGKNIFISPLSIHLALSMTYNGADGTTKEAMAKTLRLQQIDINQLNKDSATLINLLQNPDPKVEIAIANSIWARKGETFNPNFLETNKKYYLAKIESLDFTDSKTVDIINSWVSDNTKGKIPTIINPPIPPDMVMYLINAVYFKGSWTVEFDKKLTTNRSFTLNDGSKKEYPMMEQKGNFQYLENDLFQAINLPYGENKRLGMYVFLPKGNLENFVTQLTGQNWQEWLTKFLEQEGTIILPKYKLEYEKNLKDVLKELGMGIAFGDQADFSLMRENGIKDLFISEVIHKTYVDVNEEGTEAAAVTEVGVGVTAVIPEKKIFYMEVNKPFFFAIVDNKTSEILFMGLVFNPK